jgi:hypothetical protein
MILRTTSIRMEISSRKRNQRVKVDRMTRKGPDGGCVWLEQESQIHRSVGFGGHFDLEAKKV